MIPALPVLDVRAVVAHYRERFGFDAGTRPTGSPVLARDDAVLHLWGACDRSWRPREDLADRPVCSGAESFLAGTESCRIEVADVDALYHELERAATPALPGRVRDGVDRDRLRHARVRHGGPRREPPDVLQMV